MKKSFIFLVFLLIPFVTEAIGLNTNISERLNGGGEIEIYKNPSVSGYGNYICRKIVNTSSNDVFIPLKTENEYVQFINNSPSYLSKQQCDIITSCTAIPSNSTRYTATEITQYSSDGVSWSPSQSSYHSSTASTVTCVYRCNPGYFYNGASCPAAGPGYYAPGYANTSQIPCNIGSYQPSSAQTSCISASAGYYVPTTAQSYQTACSAGSYQASGGQSSCNLASPGYYVSSTAQTGQSPCGGNNVYCPGSGNTGPTGVSTGYYSTGGGSTTRTGQSICEPGNSCNGGVKTACSPGYYQPNSGQTSCIAASPGYYVPGSGASNQTACNAGSYQPGSAQTSCISASAGYYVPTTAQSYQTACPAGYYQPSTGQSACAPAGTGYYVPTTGQANQTSCTNKPSYSSYTSSSALTSNSCPWSCNSSYHLEGGVCVYDYKTVSCSSIPSNSSYNTVSSITQGWNGSTYLPTTSTSYNTSGSSSECRYRCNSGYEYSGGSCPPANCSSTTSNGYSVSSMLHGGSTTPSKTVSVTNGSQVCSQTFSCSYGSVNVGTQTCSPVVCDSGYYWNGSSCQLITYTLNYGGWGSCTASPTWSSWGTCSATCNGGTQSRTCTNTSGTQTRSASCIRNYDGASVSMSNCGTAVTTQSCSGTCSGSTTQTCNTHNCPIIGLCGGANGTTVSSAPSSNLCSSGTPSGVSGSGPWSWTCSGLYGGGNDSCSANRTPVNCVGNWADISPQECSVTCGGGQIKEIYTITTSPQHGGNACPYSNGATRWRSGSSCNTNACAVVSNGLCGYAAGQTLSAPPSAGTARCFTGDGTSVTTAAGKYFWSCNGINGGSNVSCEANQQSTGNPPPPPADTYSWKFITGPTCLDWNPYESYSSSVGINFGGFSNINPSAQLGSCSSSNNLSYKILRTGAYVTYHCGHSSPSPYDWRVYRCTKD